MMQNMGDVETPLPPFSLCKRCSHQLRSPERPGSLCQIGGFRTQNATPGQVIEVLEQFTIPTRFKVRCGTPARSIHQIVIGVYNDAMLAYLPNCSAVSISGTRRENISSGCWQQPRILRPRNMGRGRGGGQAIRAAYNQCGDPFTGEATQCSIDAARLVCGVDEGYNRLTGCAIKGSI